jgi:hypothetical protein
MQRVVIEAHMGKLAFELDDAGIERCVSNGCVSNGALMTVRALRPHFRELPLEIGDLVPQLGVSNAVLPLRCHLELGDVAALSFGVGVVVTMKNARC